MSALERKKIPQESSWEATIDLSITSWRLLPLRLWINMYSRRAKEGPLMKRPHLTHSADLYLTVRIHYLTFEWKSPADRVVGPGWICTSTLPERILSLHTIGASGSIISHLHLLPTQSFTISILVSHITVSPNWILMYDGASNINLVRIIV